ncbi:hypothetical protein B9D88_032350 [Burkholderia pseudomallei]|nr:hypothetical protein B9D88_032350 [Burkholderia pseudomallei]
MPRFARRPVIDHAVCGCWPSVAAADWRSPIPDDRPWSSELGAWSLELGAWSSELGAWTSDFRLQTSSKQSPDSPRAPCCRKPRAASSARTRTAGSTHPAQSSGVPSNSGSASARADSAASAG